MLSMTCRMGMSAEKPRRRLLGFGQLVKVIEGATFDDGIGAIEDSRVAA